MQRMTKGCYIDGDPVNGAGGDVADPSGDTEDSDSKQDDQKDDEPEGEPDPDDKDPGDSDDPDQKKRTSKQTPEQDAAFAKIRREAEEARQELTRRDKWVSDNYGKSHGITTWAQYEAAITQSQQQETIARKAAETGKSEEEVRREMDKDRRLQELEVKAKLTERLLTLEKEKQPLKDLIYFKELEPEIDQLVTDNAKKGIDVTVEAAFHYLRSQRLDELVSKEKGKTRKSTIADVHDRMNRGLSTGSDSSTRESDISVNTEMAAAFGNDPKEIAKYVKQQTKSRR
jgi:hypothetical protein